MLAAYNLIGLISNNGNQNNDNNDNNNNDNNNNNQNVNEANTDTAGMNMGMVILPPLPPGRMLNITATNTGDKSMMELNRTRRGISAFIQKHNLIKVKIFQNKSEVTIAQNGKLMSVLFDKFINFWYYFYALDTRA